MGRVVAVNLPRLGATLASPDHPHDLIHLLGNHCASTSYFRTGIACGLAFPLLEIGAQCGTILHDLSSHLAIDFGASLEQRILLLNLRLDRWRWVTPP